MIKDFENLHHQLYGECRKGLRKGYIVYSLSDVCKAAGLKNPNHYVNNKLLQGELFLDSYEDSSSSMKSINLKSSSTKKVELKSSSTKSINLKSNSTKKVELNHNKTWWITIDGANLLLLRSNKPKAIEIQRWLVKDVLHNIQQTSKYVEGEQENGCFSIQEFADHYCNHHPLKLGQNKVFAILKNQGVLTRDNLPMRRYIDNGWLTTSIKVSANGRKSYRTLITPKGISGILGIVKEHYLDTPMKGYNPKQLLFDFDTENVITEKEYYN